MNQKRMTTFRGKEASLQEVADALGVTYPTVWRRVVIEGKTGDEIDALGISSKGRSAGTYTYGDESMTIKEWAKRVGVNERMIRYRFDKYGNPYYEAEQKYGGKSLGQLCLEHDIPISTVRARLRRGEPLEKALSPARIKNTRPSANRTVVIDGETVTIRDVMLKHGVSRSLLSSRLKSDWTLEDAVSTPPHGGRRRTEILDYEEGTVGFAGGKRYTADELLSIVYRLKGEEE